MDDTHLIAKDSIILELGPRVAWALWCENTGLLALRELTIKERVNGRRSVD